MSYNLNAWHLRALLGRVVGFADVDPESAPGLTRWGRISDGLFVGGEQWFTVEPIHGNFVAQLIRAKRVHTIMSASY